MVGCDLFLTAFFFQALGHGMNRDVALPRQQGHSFKFSPGFNQISHRLPPASNDEPPASLTCAGGGLVDTLLAKTLFHEIFGLNKISDKPALESSNLHPFNG